MKNIVTFTIDDKLEQVIIGYPTYIDPENMIAKVISFDCRTLMLSVESGAYIDLGGDDYFKVVNTNKKMLERVSRKTHPMMYREVFTETIIQKFNKELIDTVFKKGFFKNIYLGISPLASSYHNPKIIMLPIEYGDYDSDTTKGFDEVHNILYVDSNEYSEVLKTYNMLTDKHQLNFSI